MPSVLEHAESRPELESRGFVGVVLIAALSGPLDASVSAHESMHTFRVLPFGIGKNRCAIDRKSMQPMHGRLCDPGSYQGLRRFITHSPRRIVDGLG